MVKEASIRPLSDISLSGTRTKWRDFPSSPVHHVCPPSLHFPHVYLSKGMGFGGCCFHLSWCWECEISMIFWGTLWTLGPFALGMAASDSMRGEEGARSAWLHLFRPIYFCKWMDSEINLLNETIFPLLHIIWWHLLRIYHFPFFHEAKGVASTDAGPTTFGAPLFLSYQTALSAPRKSKVQIDRARTSRCLAVPILEFFEENFPAPFFSERKMYWENYTKVKMKHWHSSFLRLGMEMLRHQKLHVLEIDRTFQLNLWVKILEFYPNPPNPNANQNDCNI